MSIEKDIQTNKEQLLQGFSILNLEESANLTYNLLIGLYGEPFKRCSLYSELKDRSKLESIYFYVEFTGGTEYGDIANNTYLLRELLYYGIKHLVFFNSDKAFVVNAIATSELTALSELIQRYNFTPADAELQCLLEVIDLAKVEAEWTCA